MSDLTGAELGGVVASLGGVEAMATSRCETSRAIAQLVRLRETMARLGAWAKILESRGANHYEMTQREVAAELPQPHENTVNEDVGDVEYQWVIAELRNRMGTP